VADSGGSEADGAGDRGAQLVDKGKDAATSYALDYLKISSAERQWYAELGVDPYTDNEVLRDVIRSYSRIGGLASFGVNVVGVPIIPGARELRKTMDLVWSTDPWELRQRNRQQLLAAGISDEVARAFEDNPYLTLTQQTALVEGIAELRAVAGREHLLARAIDVGSRAEASDLVQAVTLLDDLHRDRPLVAILPGTQVPVARTADGALVAVAIAEAVFWTEQVATAASALAALYEMEAATGRELWTPARVSQRFAAEAGALGWVVRDAWRPEGQPAPR
jgi:hypothetical protein